MKKKLLITSVTAAALLTAACSNSANEEAYCVDRQGNAVDPDFCDDDYDGGIVPLFLFMNSSSYKNKYPNKYKAAKSYYKAKGYSSRSVSRGISGSSARSSVGG